MMTENEIRQFVNEATSITGDSVTVTEQITARWLQDREAATDEARDALYDDARDSWNGE
jgi:ribonuclease HI